MKPRLIWGARLKTWNVHDGSREISYVFYDPANPEHQVVAIVGIFNNKGMVTHGL